MELVFFYINQTDSQFIEKKGFNFSANYNFSVDYLNGKYVLKQNECKKQLGDFIKMIRDADEQSPLYRLNQYIEEIEELNDYSKIYHHSNPNYMDVIIDPVELSIQVKNTINLLYIL